MLKKIDSILYVEDEKTIQNECSSFLQIFCKHLYLAKDGVEGLKLYKETKPDLIISDIKMPNMNGIDMISKIKNISPKIPVIFTTAFNDSNYLQEAIKLQVDGYILKPIDLEQFEELLIKIIYTLNMEKKQSKLKNNLEQSNSDLQSIFDFMNCGMASISYDSRILKVNDSLCKILDIKRNCIIEKNCREVKGLEQFQLGKEIFDEIVENGIVRKKKLIIENSRNKTIEVFVEGFILPNSKEIFLSFNWL